MNTDLYSKLKKLNEGSQTKVKMERSSKTYCIVSLYGGVIMSWVCNGHETLFFPKSGEFDRDHITIGGIAVEFPIYDKVTPERVFSKYQQWKVHSGPQQKPNGDVELVLALTDNIHTRGMWNRKFLLVYTIILMANGLNLEAQVTNLSDKVAAFNMHFCCNFLFENMEDIVFTGLPISNVKEFPHYERGIDVVYPKIKSPVCIGEHEKHVLFEYSKPYDIALWIPIKENLLLKPDGYKQSLIIEEGIMIDLIETQKNECHKSSLNIYLSGVPCSCSEKTK